MPVKGSRPKFRTTYYVRIYKMANTGLKDKQIAAQLGVRFSTFRSWRKTDPAVRDALEQARALAPDGKAVDSLNNFVYQRLPRKLQPLWEAICEADEEPNGEKRLELLTKNCGRRAKQHLWLHALVVKHFNKNEACRVTNISKSTVDLWIQSDPEFMQLIDSIMEMKRDFIEGALMGLISQGDSAATIFAAKTLCKKMGYDPKVTVEVQGSMTHKHIDLNQLLDQMSIDTRKEIVKAFQQKNPPKALPKHDPDVVDVDYEVIDEED